MPKDDPGIDAAAKVIYEAGRFYRWGGFNQPYDNLDPIGRDEFDGIIEQALKAADAARKHAQSEISSSPTTPAFPADYELLSFFDAEPTLLDAKVPWFYNTLDFHTQRNGIEVQCRLRPSYGEIKTRLLVGGLELARVDVQSFKSVRLVIDEGRDILIATVDRTLREETFALILKPRVWVGFGDLRGLP
jgi:hypothetical protein